MKLFWLLLGLAILFVIGSALALNALGRDKSSNAKKTVKKDRIP